MAFPIKILAIKLRALGDTVLLTAPLTALRRAYPRAQLHVVVDERWAELLEGHPAITKIWRRKEHRNRALRLLADLTLALRLRGEGFARAICFHASPSSARLCLLSGAPIRSVHFHGHKDENRFSTVKVPGKGVLKPIIERDMDAVRALGIQVPAGELPSLYLTSDETLRADARLSNIKELAQPILGIGLGASRPTKKWPIERFASVAVAWCREGGSVYAFAGPAEKTDLAAFKASFEKELGALAAEEAEGIRQRLALENSLGLRELAALLSRLAVYLGNDSGPKHIAAAVGTPTVTLFGPEDPYEWHPYPRDSHVALFVGDLGCRRDALPGMRPWCGLPGCTTEKHQCMTRIGVDQVLSECKKVQRRKET